MRQDNNIGEIKSIYLDPNSDRIRKIFNYYIARLYSDIGFLLDDNTRDQIYPVVYGYMHTILERSIRMNVKPYEYNKEFPIHASKAVNVAMKMNNVNPISPKYSLSLAFGNEIQRDITLSLAADIIALNLNINEDKAEKICSKYDIKESQYKNERKIVLENISKMYKENFGFYLNGNDAIKKRLKK